MSVKTGLFKRVQLQQILFNVDRQADFKAKKLQK